MGCHWGPCVSRSCCTTVGRAWRTANVFLIGFVGPYFYLFLVCLLVRDWFLWFTLLVGTLCIGPCTLGFGVALIGVC